MKTMNFTSTHGLYLLAGNTNDMANQVSERLAQLEAMLGTVCGESGRIFREEMPENAQEHFMWACLSMANEVRQLFAEIMERGEK